MDRPSSPQPGPSNRLDPEISSIYLRDQLTNARALSFFYTLRRTVSEAGGTPTADGSANNVASDAVAIAHSAQDHSDEVVVLGSELAQAPPVLPPKGVLYRKQITAGDVYIVKKPHSRHWGLAKVLVVICNVRDGVKNNRHVVAFGDQTTQTKPVLAEEMAYYEMCNTIIPKGSGVVCNAICSNSRKYYPGIVIETPDPTNKFRYLVFFDSGDFKYCNHDELRVICDAYKSHTSSDVDLAWLRDAILHPDPFLLKFRLGDSVSALQNDLKTHVEGTVDEIDCSIIRLKFPDGRVSWYHRGSYHFKRILIRDLPPHLKRTIHKRRHLLQLQKVYGKPAVPNLAVTNSRRAILPAGPSLQLELFSKRSSTITRLTAIEPRLHFASSSKKKRVTPLLIKIPRDLGLHKCNPGCVASEGDIAKIDPSYSPLAKPYSIGFLRRTSEGLVRYVAPCGKAIQNEDELSSYFVRTNLALCHTNFNFSAIIDPLRIFQLDPDCIVAQKSDITNGSEAHPIPCVNEVDDTLPEPIKYITKRELMTVPQTTIDYENFVSCCSCTDDCQDLSKCECAMLTLSSYLDIAPHETEPLKPQEVLYQHKRLLHEVRSGVYECNSKCKCSSKCGNRVAQFPISCKLQLFQTSTKGWGVRTLHDIPKGTFICKYVGILLNELEANEWGILHGDQYLMDLDHIKVREECKPGYEEDAPLLSPEEDEEERASSKNDSEKRRLMAEATAKLRKRQGERPKWSPRKKKRKNGMPRYPKTSLRCLFPLDQAEYVIDAKTSGNIGRYFNHSCDPIMFVQSVFIDTHDLRFPEIAFFAAKDVLAGTELTWDYHYRIGSVGGGKRLYCLCLTQKCRVRLY